MDMSRIKAASIFALILVVLVGVSLLAEELTGDEILAKVDVQGTKGAVGSFTARLVFDTTMADGTSRSTEFGSVSKKTKDGADYSLTYLLAPEDVFGRILLSHTEKSGETTQWFYLPAYQLVRKLDVNSQQQSFAGSNLSFGDIARQEMSSGYVGTLLREETILIGEEDRLAYVLTITARPDVNVDHQQGTVWIDKQEYVLLKAEYVDAEGEIESTMEVLGLTTVENEIVPAQILSTDVLEQTSTKITFVSRKYLSESIPDSVFDPENLGSFDPEVYGLTN